MFEIIFALVFGLFLGVACGLLPGLHPNTTIPIVLSLSFLFDPLSLAIVLITSAVVNSFLNFIPSILLGAPESENALAVLPGHALLMQGRGYEAIKLSVLGGLGAVLFVLLTLPLFAAAVPFVYSQTRSFVHWLLIFVVCYMILSENSMKNRIFAFVVFALSGLLGLIVLGDVSGVSGVNEPLFPMLSGLFGLPILFLSIRQKTKLPESFSFEQERLGNKTIFSGVAAGSIAGILAGLLPGIGSAQATVLAQEAVGREEADVAKRKFLIAVGGVNTADVIYSLFAIWLLGNPRSGIAVAVSNLVAVGFEQVLVFTAVVALAAGFAAYLTLKLSRKAVFLLKRLDYPKLCKWVFVLICVLIVLFSGWAGLAIAAIAFSIGLVPNLAGIRRSHCMGCLLLPTILFFAGI